MSAPHGTEAILRARNEEQRAEIIALSTELSRLLEMDLRLAGETRKFFECLPLSQRAKFLEIENLRCAAAGRANEKARRGIATFTHWPEKGKGKRE